MAYKLKISDGYQSRKIILLVPILVNVAFITLLERKILGYSQLRKGPNKVSIIGLAQPFNDAIKLFTKEIVYPKLSNILQYLITCFEFSLLLHFLQYISSLNWLILSALALILLSR